MKNTFLLALICALFSCTNPGSKNVDQVASKESAREIEKASWLIGKWNNISEDGSIVEMWEKFNDSIYVGKSYFIRGTDTVSSESIKLVQDGNELSYVPTVKNQNDGQPVRFKLISSDSNKLIFKNRAHDFPQTISYYQLSSDSLLAEISGLVKGELRSEKFPMRRVK